MKYLDHLIETNPKLANNRELDQSKIDKILRISNTLKLIKILIFVTSVSFFFAMMFKFLTNVESDIMNWDEYSGDRLPDDEPDHFMSKFNQAELSENEQVIVLFYFSFTTLTTVGFGDLNPRSNAERIYMAFGMLIGVAVFSYYMGELIEMISLGSDDDEEADDLAKFFGLLKNFNYN